MKDKFKLLNEELLAGYTSMRSMRGSSYNGFNYQMLENSLKVSMQRYDRLLIKNFDKDILQSVKNVCKAKGIETFSPDFFDELKQQYVENRYSPKRYFFDMDGVLYTFNNRISSPDVLFEENYFLNLPQQRLAAHCMHKMLEEHPHQVYILSHYLDSPYAKKEKLTCLHKHFPELDDCNILLIPYGEQKVDFVPEGIKTNDILIDDYNKNLKEWSTCGGQAIKFVNSINDVMGWDGERMYYDDPNIVDSLKNIAASITSTATYPNISNTLMEERLHKLEDAILLDK